MPFDKLSTADLHLDTLYLGDTSGNGADDPIAAELKLELGRERRAAAREPRRPRNQPLGRPRALTAGKVEQVVKLQTAGESVPEIAKTFGVGRDTIYRAIRQADDSNEDEA